MIFVASFAHSTQCNRVESWNNAGPPDDGLCTTRLQDFGGTRTLGGINHLPSKRKKTQIRNL